MDRASVASRTKIRICSAATRRVHCWSRRQGVQSDPCQRSANTYSWLVKRGHAKRHFGHDGPPCPGAASCAKSTGDKSIQGWGTVTVELLTCRARRVLQLANRRTLRGCFYQNDLSVAPYRRNGSGGCRIATAATASHTRESPPLSRTPS